MNSVITTMLTASWHGELLKLITHSLTGHEKCCYARRTFWPLNIMASKCLSVLQ